MTEPTMPQLDAAARTLSLLVAPVRLHLLWLAMQAETDVGTLAQRTGVTITTASHHLAKLRLAGLITARREGRRHIYTVDDPHIVNLLTAVVGGAVTARY
jgi:DNA-binding transcriptional ArsR family regulator